MSDIFQTHSLVTIPAINPDTGHLEDFLKENLLFREACCILPCLQRDMGGPAMDNIIAQHEAMSYPIERLIILQQANKDQYIDAYQRWSVMEPNVTILWMDGPRFNRVLAQMNNAGIYTGVPGKGRAVWFAAGYVIGARRAQFVVLHDCDIVTFNKGMVTRLLYPLVHRAQGYEFVKAYFHREKAGYLMGRVCTKFMSPMVTALLQRDKFKNDPFLQFLSELRYPLSGEFGMTTNLLARMRIPSGYDLEIVTLYEVFEKTSKGQRAQVDLGFNYDHHHQILKAGETKAAPEGLEKMVMEITKALINILRERGVDITTDDLRSIIPDYQREAEDAIFKLDSVAKANGFNTDWVQEEKSVKTFVRALHNLVREGERAGNGHAAIEQKQHQLQRVFAQHLGNFFDVIGNVFRGREKQSDEVTILHSLLDTMKEILHGVSDVEESALEHVAPQTLQTWNRIIREFDYTYPKALYEAVSKDMDELTDGRWGKA